MTPEPRHLLLPDGRQIAYRQHSGRQPGVVFLGGLRSDMTGTKARFVESYARDRGVAVLCFDYTGHGASSGSFEAGAIGDWRRDARDALAQLTEGPQILIGSSMGGWIALLLARDDPDRAAALIGIAAAPDFTEDSMWAELPTETRIELMREGRVEVPSDYAETPYVVTRRLIEDGRQNLVLRSPLTLRCPVRLLHGTADADVPVSVALRLLEHLDGPDTMLTLAKAACHRFSGARELALLARTLDALREDLTGRATGRAAGD